MREEDPEEVETEVNDKWKVDSMMRFKTQEEQARKYGGRAGRLFWTEEEQKNIDGGYSSTLPDPTERFTILDL